MKSKFNFNFSFLNRFKSKASSEEVNDVDDELQSSNDGNETEIIYSDESPEDFAERTLGGYSLDKFREEERRLSEEALPEKPEATSRFKIRFPKFGKFSREEVTREIKNRLSNGSPLNTLDKVTWSDFVVKLFSPYNREKVHGVFVILLVVTFTYLIGKSTALFLSRSNPIVTQVKPSTQNLNLTNDTTISDLNKISATNLFNAKETDKMTGKKVKPDISKIVCDEADKPTSLPVKLMDTIVLQDSVKSVASVQLRGAEELLNLREGEQIDSNVEISRISRMRLILKNLETGECEYVASEDNDDSPIPTSINIVSAKKGQSLFKSSNPNIKNVGNSFTIKRKFRDQMINNMSDVLTQAKAVQIVNPDGSLSFKMTEIVPGSIYSQLNIQENDIVTSINGKKIENLNELMGLLGKIKEIDQFQIGLKRNGMSENLEYGFE